MAPTSLTLFAGLLVFGTALAAPVAKPQGGATFTLGNPETTVTFEPGFAPPRDSPEFPKWLWYYWLNKYKQDRGEDDGPGRFGGFDRPEDFDDFYGYDNFDGPSAPSSSSSSSTSGSASTSLSWGKRGEPIKPGLPLCTSVKKGVLCLGNPTTTVTVTNPPDEEPEYPEYPEDPEWPEEEPEPEDPEWPEPEPPKGWPKPPTKPNYPPKYPPTKPEPPKYPSQPPKYPPYEPEEPDYPWDPEPEEPAGGSISTSTYCTDAKKGITWNC